MFTVLEFVFKLIVVVVVVYCCLNAGVGMCGVIMNHRSMPDAFQCFAPMPGPDSARVC